MANENKHIRRIYCTYSVLFNKNKLISEQDTENHRVRRMSELKKVH